MKIFKKKAKDRSTIVFVTNQKRCVNLIKIGKKIAKTSKTSLIVANISPTKLNVDGATALNYLFEQTTASGGEMKIVYADDFFEEMKKFIVDFKGLHVVTGRPEDENSIVYKLQREMPDNIFYTVVPEEEEYIARNDCERIIVHS